MKKYYIAAIISILYIPLVTILGELFSPLKDFFKKIFWHHWLGKGAVLLMLFLGICLALYRKKEEKIADEKYLSFLVLFSSVGALSIFAFFVFEYFKGL